VVVGRNKNRELAAGLGIIQSLDYRGEDIGPRELKPLA